jgi:hypothetical protein
VLEPLVGKPLSKPSVSVCEKILLEEKINKAANSKCSTEKENFFLIRRFLRRLLNLIKQSVC